jgi:hypothetical protein
MKYFILILLFNIFLIGNLRAAEEIWHSDNSWNEYWEESFGQWISSNVDEDFFYKNNIETDCADAIVGLRWIFARNNSLPAANYIEGTSELFGNFSMKESWQNLPTGNNWNEDKLFLKALRYVMDETSTRSIDNDGYPVKLTQEGLLPGTYIITKADDSRHTRIITNSDFTTPTSLPFITKSSTSPVGLRKLFQETLIDEAWPSQDKKLFLSFRWPVKSGSTWVLLSASEHPRYSEEQFDPTLAYENPSFVKFLIERTKNQFDATNIILLGINEIINSLQQRMLIVDQGYLYCQSQNCHEGTQGFDEWSTYERDSKIVHKYSDFKSLIDNYEIQFPESSLKWNEGLANTKIIILDRPLSLYEVQELFINKRASSYPLDNPNARWGLKNE